MNTSYFRFRIFQYMWLLFILFHMVVSFTGWTTIGDGFLNPSNLFFLIANILVVVFCLASLFRPHNMLYFVLSLLFLTAVKLDIMPVVPNHIILMLIIHLTIFLSLILYWDRSLKFEERIARWFDKTTPYLRIELLIVYFFVVLHKLNYDFFNPDVSCAAELYTEIANLYPFLPGGAWISWTMIVSTLLVELLIPILLIIPSTRVLGIFIGLTFHLMLSLHPNLMILSFTAELYALFVLFLPKEIIVQIFTRVKKTNQINILKRLIWLTGGSLLVLTGYLAQKILLRGDFFSVSLLKDGLFNSLMVIWLIWGLLLITGILILSRGRLIYPQRSSSSLFKLSWSPLLFLLLLTVFNGITPYIGLKTATNFAMFSNLRVVGADNNHLFIPSDFQVSEFQKDTVTLHSANHRDLEEFIDRDEQVTYFELSKFLYQNRRQNIRVTFRRNDKVLYFRHPQQQVDYWEELSWMTRKLLIFRSIPKSNRTPCQW